MDGIVDDPSEWPMEFIELKRIDNLLRCSICFEFFNIAMTVPSCSHNYCSICIRKHISYKKCCPTCNLPLIDSDLKCNRVLDEVVKHFKPIRSILIDLVKWCLKSGFKYPTLKKKDPNTDTNKENHSADEYEFEILPTFRSPNNMHNKSRKIENKMMTSGGESSQQEIGACPVCNIKVPIGRINIHLDSCLMEQGTSTRLSSVKQIKKMTPIPKTCLNTLKYKELQSKAKIYGLYTEGNRKQLVKRIEQFILQYNSQCDAPNPMTSSMVAKQTNENEKILRKHGYTPGIVIHPHDQRYTSKDREDFNKKYAKENEKQFKELIENIKERQSENLSTRNKEKLVTGKSKMADIELIEITEKSPEETKNCIEINNHSTLCLTNNSGKNDSNVKSGSVKIVDKPKKKLNTTTKKKHTVRSRNIGSFFTASSNTIIEDENIETTVKLKDNINNKSNVLLSIAEEIPIQMDEPDADFQCDVVQMDNKNSLIILDDDIDDDEIMPCTSRTLTPQPHASNVPQKVMLPKKLHGYNAVNTFNSTINELPVTKTDVEPLSIDDDLSPVVCKKINNSRDKLSYSNRFKRAGSYSLESRLSGIPEKCPRILDYPIDDKLLWGESDASTDSHDSELSAEINNLVEKAIANPLSVSSDSENSESLLNDFIANEIFETENLLDNEIIIPMPPTDINFTQLESQ